MNVALTVLAVAVFAVFAAFAVLGLAFMCSFGMEILKIVELSDNRGQEITFRPDATGRKSAIRGRGLRWVSGSKDLRVGIVLALAVRMAASHYGPDDL